MTIIIISVCSRFRSTNLAKIHCYCVDSAGGSRWTDFELKLFKISCAKNTFRHPRLLPSLWIVIVSHDAASAFAAFIYFFAKWSSPVFHFFGFLVFTVFQYSEVCPATFRQRRFSFLFWLAWTNHTKLNKTEKIAWKNFCFLSLRNVTSSPSFLQIQMTE